jgi:cobalamin biosynthesis Co2+ chelatase CbiK
MRPAYTQLIDELKKDLNRITNYTYNQVYETLLHIATEEEKKYLESEYNQIEYERTAVELSKLILGVNDDAPTPLSTLNKTITAGAITSLTIARDNSKYTGVEYTPQNRYQMELDL